MKQQTSQIKLIIERSEGAFWGRAEIKGNLIVESANTIQSLKKKMKDLIFEFESIAVEEFSLSFDLTSFFQEHSYLNASDIAKRAGINPALMRQYTSGVKFPSEDRVKDIAKAINQIGKELSKINLHKAVKEYA